MTRLQQSGLIALVLLLVAAGVSGFLGRGKVTEESVETSAVVLEPGSQDFEVDLYAEHERLSAEDFRRAPQADPLDAYEVPVVPPAEEQEDEASGLQFVDLAEESAAPPPAPAPQRKIIVRPNDTLQRIASRELGDSKLWRLIASTNSIRDPRSLRAGQTLLLPADGALQASRAAMSGEPAAATGASQEHVVRSDETLGEISQQYYGTSKHWRHILEANGMTDPRELRAGKTIRIPPPPR
jgi:nucleoid-associated protein YgaU